MIFKKYKGWIKWLVLGLALLILGFMPLPYYIEQPGELFAVDDLIKIEGKKPISNFSITTVGITQATPLSALRALMPFNELISEKELLAGVDDYDTYDFMQFLYMEDAANTATEVAYREARADYTVKNKGAYVFEVLKASTFHKKLQAGDLITQVNDQPIKNSSQFMEQIEKLTENQKVQLAFKRKKQVKEVSGKLTAFADGKLRVGISLIDAKEVSTSPEATIDFEDIEGPSAGLMYTLYMYNELTDKHLDQERKIAGTGTIAADGSVGPIGGVEKKVAAAAKAGAEIFLVPRDKLSKAERKKYPKRQSNYQLAKAAARQLHTQMKIVPVDSFKEAVDYLEK